MPLHETWVRGGALLGLALLLAACAAPPPSGSPAPEPGLRWRKVAEPDLPSPVRERLQQIQRQNQTGIWQLSHGDATYLLVTWGHRPTAGYRVDVEDLRPAGPGTLVVWIRLRTPAPDERVPQVITYPYAAVEVRPAGTYRLAPVFLGAHFLQNAAFEVLEPMPFTVLRDGVRVRGRARVLEATFMVRVEDAAGTLLEQSAMSREGGPAWGEFDVRLPFPRAPQGGEGRVVLYEASAKDGTPLHTMAIPVRFAR